MTNTEAVMSNQYLTLTISDEQYAIPVTDIREVLTIPKITRIPRMPEYMRGVCNVRGSVVPVLDIKQKFGLGQTERTVETAVIIAEITYHRANDQEETLYLGMLADTVRKVVTIEAEDIEPAPRIGIDIDTDFIRGMGRLEGEFTTILDIEKVLTSDDFELLSTVQEESESIERE